MMKLLVLLVAAVWVHSRRLMEDFNNEIVRSSSLERDWVQIVQSPPPLISRSVGSRIELECEAMGSPAPEMQWIKDGTPVTEVQNESFETNVINSEQSHGMAKVISRLVIDSVLPMHEGTFTCLAESGSETASSDGNLYVRKNFTQLLASEILAVHSAARITLFNTVFVDTIGSNIKLPCKAVGNPTPEIVWFDQFEEVVDNGKSNRHSVSENGELRIRNIRWEDMGVYKCAARNNVGKDDISTFLYPMLPEK